MSSFGIDSSRSSTLWPRRLRLIPGVDLSGPVPFFMLDRAAGEDAEGMKGAAVIDAQVGAGVLLLEVMLVVVLFVISSVVLSEGTWASGDPIGMLAKIVCSGR
jgi:hypothetical protein